MVKVYAEQAIRFVVGNFERVSCKLVHNPQMGQSVTGPLGGRKFLHFQISFFKFALIRQLNGRLKLQTLGVDAQLREFPLKQANPLEVSIEACLLNGGTILVGVLSMEILPTAEDRKRHQQD